MNKYIFLLLFIIASSSAFAQANNIIYKAISEILMKVMADDQEGREKLDSIYIKYGANSPQSKELWKIISYKDSTNQLIVQYILNNYGWLGTDEIGEVANMAIFLVIQHADLKIQEHYLPLMRGAVKIGKAFSGNLALLEDRVALRQGKKQTYGSQLVCYNDTCFVQPLDDPDNVDKRRAEVDLAPISEYVAQWHIVWNAKEYKKKLPQLEARLRKDGTWTSARK